MAGDLEITSQWPAEFCLAGYAKVRVTCRKLILHHMFVCVRMNISAAMVSVSVSELPHQHVVGMSAAESRSS